MRKEYSDLPDHQKLIYVKRSVIELVCACVPTIIIFGLLGFTLFSYQTAVENTPELQTMTNSTATEIKNGNDVWVSHYFALIMILFFASMFGLINLGFGMGNWLANKLNLYTDFELEHAERKVAEIKKIIGERSEHPTEGRIG